MGITEINGEQLSDADNLRSGLLATRPTLCNVGDVYLATDKNWHFVCFAPNTWSRVNAVDLTGAAAGDYFKYDGVTGFLIPTTVSALQYGLDADKPASPKAGDVYMATDTQVMYYCFEDGIWTTTYLISDRLYYFERDENADIEPVTADAIFESDGVGDLMPTLDGLNDPQFEIISGEITPKV